MKIDTAAHYTEHLSDILQRKQFASQSDNTPYSSNIHQDLEMASAHVNCFRDVSTSNDVALHSHNFHELILVESGELQYLLGEKIYDIRKGHFIMIPAGISHRPIIPENGSTVYSRISLWISTAYWDLIHSLWPALNNYGTEPMIPRITDISPPKFEHLWKYFEASAIESNTFDDYSFAFLAGNTICLLAKAAGAHFTENQTIVAEKKELLSKIITYIEMHYMEKITLDTVINHFHVSKSGLSKLFQDKLNVSFYSYVTQRRLAESKLLLQQGVDLNEVADMVGFSDYSNFYRAFKKEYGIAPSQYRSIIL